MFWETPLICVLECVNFPSFRFSDVFSKSSAAFSKKARNPAFTSSEPDFMTVLQSNSAQNQKQNLNLWPTAFSKRVTHSASWADIWHSSHPMTCVSRMEGVVRSRRNLDHKVQRGLAMGWYAQFEGLCVQLRRKHRRWFRMKLILATCYTYCGYVLKY